MTPSFALSLSSEGVALLRRQPSGWALIDEAGFGGADPDAAISALRTRAEDLSAEGGRVLLVIPDDQIRYLDLADPGGDANTREAAIRTALDGATPYPLDQLVYDWSAAHGRMFAAAVARETLQEAEAFAVQHGFEPLGHVAAPGNDVFAGSVDFGRASTWTGKAPERLPAAIRVIPADEAALRPEPRPLPPAPPPEAEAPSSASVAIVEPEPEPTPAEPAAPDAPRAEPPVLKLNHEFGTPAPGKTDAAPAPEPTTPPITIAAPTSAAQPPSQPKAAKAAPFASEPGDLPPDPRVSAQSLRRRFTPVPQPDAALRDARVTEGRIGDDELAPDASGKGLSFSSGRADTAPEDDVPEVPTALGKLRTRKRRGSGTPAAGPKPRKQPAAPAATPAAAATTPDPIPGPAAPVAPPRPTPATDSATALSREEELERMTLFGARGREHDRPAARPTGLIAAGIGLLALAAIAGWASVRFDDRIAALFGGGDTSVAALTAPESETPPETAAAPAPAAPEPEEQTETAALPEAPDDATALQPLGPEEAAATYAATGIWQRGPNGPLEPAPTLLGDVYVASIDPEVTQQDAVALPATDDLVQEAALPDPGLTPPPGMVFDLDARGLVRPSAEGTRAPSGHSVFTGLPPAVPPDRNPAPQEEETTSEETPGAVPEEALPEIRPEARPDDIVESRERAQLSGLSRDELVDIRPVRRPPTAQEEATAANPSSPATEQAVTASLVPLGRPRDMAAIVEQADATITQAAAAPAPQRSVQPDIPSNTNVAREATVTNALNLRQTNLIGVYGTPENRRALVRLPNGNYEKVKVGDRIDGGRVAAIGEAQLRYVKGGRSITLDMPRG
ncbi:hypothetical protein [Allosediminivita pacifica]|uniref:Type IV pilus biogenesis protein PilP n=1 Tax=Allosediminivita pacifica TaxID=1267769 RepID=A0A2T6B0V0_9RHOB|nr:hypothetical protein [Allosediminivita pacifica]PTX49716.1 hypothetical protein C8N44_10694 [Allosediminivita pacifica]GGB04058.1 hypothetical protein GCM10011324_12810 [Allosediminivita pacifica]